jgi:hypothetical protein
MQQESIYITTSKKPGLEVTSKARKLAFFLNAKFQKRGFKTFRKIKEKAEKYGCKNIVIIEKIFIRLHPQKKHFKAKVNIKKKSEVNLNDCVESKIFNLEHVKELKKENKIYFLNPKTRKILEIEISD